MSGITILFISIVLSLVIGLLFGLMFSYYFLLKRIATKFPKYYTQLGSPFLPTASRRSIAKTIGRDNYNYALLNKLLNGVPGGFPNDALLRRLVFQVRFEMFAIIGLIGLGIGFSIMTYLIN